MNPFPSSSLLTTLFSLFLFPSLLEALVIPIPAGKIKCLTEDVDPKSLSVATYRVAGDPPHPHNMSARVTDPHGDIIHLAHNVESGQFVFAAKVPGHYSICFWSPLFKLTAQIEVDFQWTTGIPVSNGFHHKVAKKQNVDAVEADLKKLEDTISSIHAEMRFLREREAESRDINEDTSSTMSMLTLLSLAICLTVAGLQTWHLKTFFEREKIL